MRQKHTRPQPPWHATLCRPHDKRLLPHSLFAMPILSSFPFVHILRPASLPPTARPHPSPTLDRTRQNQPTQNFYFTPSVLALLCSNILLLSILLCLFSRFSSPIFALPSRPLEAAFPYMHLGGTPVFTTARFVADSLTRDNQPITPVYTQTSPRTFSQGLHRLPIRPQTPNPPTPVVFLQLSRSPHHARQKPPGPPSPPHHRSRGSKHGAPSVVLAG